MKSLTVYKANDATDFISEHNATDWSEETVTVDGCRCRWSRIGGWCSFFETRNEAIKHLRAKHEERIKWEQDKLHEFNEKYQNLPP